MNKNIKEIVRSFISLGIVCIITGAIFNILHRPDSEIYVSIGLGFTYLLTAVAFVEIILSKSMGNLSKALWAVCLMAFNPLAVLVYFYHRQKVEKQNVTQHSLSSL